MKIGCVQSNYMPWRGYFDLIDESDLFLVYDHVDYSSGTWRNRNRIKTCSGLLWLTVPVLFSLDQPRAISNTLIDYTQHWQRKHCSSLAQAYGKTHYFNKYSEQLFDLINRSFTTISQLNIELIRWICRILSIDTPIQTSMDLLHEGKYPSGGTKTDRLIQVLYRAGATRFLTGPTAENYLEKDKLRAADLGLEYMSYNYLEYPQRFKGFEPQVSIVDLIFNCGPESRKYIKSREPTRVIL